MCARAPPLLLLLAPTPPLPVRRVRPTPLHTTSIQTPHSKGVRTWSSCATCLARAKTARRPPRSRTKVRGRRRRVFAFGSICSTLLGAPAVCANAAQPPPYHLHASITTTTTTTTRRQARAAQARRARAQGGRQGGAREAQGREGGGAPRGGQRGAPRPRVLPPRQQARAQGRAGADGPGWGGDELRREWGAGRALGVFFLFGSCATPPTAQRTHPALVASISPRPP